MNRSYPFRCGSFAMKKYAEQFYKSNAWKQCRETYIKSVGYLCEDCLEKGKYVPAEEVHHKIFLNPRNINDPNITLNFKNLVALCRECHKKRHYGTESRVEIDQYGRVRPK